MYKRPIRTQYQTDPRLSQRIAEEALLLSEERWIIDALKKIKAQRNGLQIERLHLESIRSRIVAEQNKTQLLNTKSNEKISEVKLADIPEDITPNTNLYNNINMPTESVMDYNELCNTEALNLTVTDSIFNNDPFGTECDEEDDEEEMENCLLDMDMLMSSK